MEKLLLASAGTNPKGVINHQPSCQQTRFLFYAGHDQWVCHVQRKLCPRYNSGKDYYHQASAVSKFVSSAIEITRRFFIDVVENNIMP